MRVEVNEEENALAVVSRAQSRRLIQPLSHRVSFPFHLIPLFPHGCVPLLQLTALGLCFVQLLAKRVSFFLKTAIENSSCHESMGGQK